MKKYIISILSVAAITFGVTSCNLDRFPEDQITTETYWNTEKDARLALNGVYAFLGGEASNSWYNDAYADNAYAQYPWESTATVAAAGDITANTNFGYSWGIIRRANTFMANIGRVSMDESLKQRFIAEVKFLRAFSYFNLAQTFGKIPLFEEPVPSNDKLQPVDENTVVDFVVKQLTEAAEVLPVSYPGGVGTEKGRVTKGAALALKARVQLYYGRWADAAATAKQVMDMGVYSLFKATSVSEKDKLDDWSRFVDFASPADEEAFYKGLASYQQLFWEANEDNNEFILTSQYVRESPYEWSSGIFTLFMPNEVSGWSSITPTIALVDAYWNSDGSEFQAPTLAERAANYNNGDEKPAYFDEFKNRDTRLYASIMFPTSKWNALADGFTFNWARGGNNTSRTGYNFKKLVDPNFTNGQFNAPQDYPIIRYAEVLLTYAEAKNEQSGPDTSVYEALDLIRQRVGMPTIERNQTKESLREIIRNERRIELAGEGFRRADIRRWGIADEVMHNIYDITNSLVQKRVWEDKFVKFPYPQSAVDVNPLLQQAQAEKGY